MVNLRIISYTVEDAIAIDAHRNHSTNGVYKTRKACRQYEVPIASTESNHY